MKAEHLLRNYDRLCAVIRALEVLGEAAGKVSPGFPGGAAGYSLA
jgi:uncharacterized protein with HEPN domain